MTFHFVLRDGKVPTFWSKIKVDTLYSCLPETIKRKFGLGVAGRGHEYFVQGMDLPHAVAKAQEEEM